MAFQELDRKAPPYGGLEPKQSPYEEFFNNNGRHIPTERRMKLVGGVSEDGEIEGGKYHADTFEVAPRAYGVLVRERRRREPEFYLEQGDPKEWGWHSVRCLNADALAEFCRQAVFDAMEATKLRIMKDEPLHYHIPREGPPRKPYMLSNFDEFGRVYNEFYTNLGTQIGGPQLEYGTSFAPMEPKAGSEEPVGVDKDQPPIRIHVDIVTKYFTEDMVDFTGKPLGARVRTPREFVLDTSLTPGERLHVWERVLGSETADINVPKEKVKLKARVVGGVKLALALTEEYGIAGAVSTAMDTEPVKMFFKDGGASIIPLGGSFFGDTVRTGLKKGAEQFAKKSGKMGTGLLRKSKLATEMDTLLSGTVGAPTKLQVKESELTAGTRPGAGGARKTRRTIGSMEQYQGGISGQKLLTGGAVGSGAIESAPQLPPRLLGAPPFIPPFTITVDRMFIESRPTGDKKMVRTVEEAVRNAGYSDLPDVGGMYLGGAPVDPREPSVSRYAVLNARNQPVLDGQNQPIILGADTIEAMFRGDSRTMSSSTADTPTIAAAADSQQATQERRRTSSMSSRASGPAFGAADPAQSRGSAQSGPPLRPITTTGSGAPGILTGSPVSITAGDLPSQALASSPPVSAAQPAATYESEEDDIYNDPPRGASRVTKMQAEATTTSQVVAHSTMQEASPAQRRGARPADVAVQSPGLQAIISVGETALSSQQESSGDLHQGLGDASPSARHPILASNLPAVPFATPQAEPASPTREAIIDSARAVQLEPAISTGRVSQGIVGQDQLGASTQAEPASTSPAGHATMSAVPVVTTRESEGDDSDRQAASLAAMTERLLIAKLGYSEEEARAVMSHEQGRRVIAAHLPAVNAEISAAHRRARSTTTESAHPPSTQQAPAPPVPDAVRLEESSSALRPLSPRKEKERRNMAGEIRKMYSRGAKGPSEPPPKDAGRGSRT